MQVTIRQEAGFDMALYGFSLSFKDRAIPPGDWWDMCGSMGVCLADDNGNCCDCEASTNNTKHADKIDERMTRTQKAALANCGRGGGHDKWIRQVVLWLDVEAPRYFFSELDTYKVGTVAQSESTMHTLSRRNMILEDLEYIEDLSLYENSCVLVDNFNLVKQQTNDIATLKRYVPESYLQRRLITMNYEVLRTIINQRENHRLPEWATFIDALYAQCEHPELLPNKENK